jgi:uncharacterized protein (DUF58 family)
MEKIGYLLLLIALLSGIISILLGISPFSLKIIALFAVAGITILFIKVLKERFSSKEDDHYSKSVEK